MLVGPGVGSFMMRTLGPIVGIFVNTVFYLPLLLWLMRAPYGRHFRGTATGPKRAVRGLADIVQTIRDVRGLPVLGAMVLLAGAASFFIGNSYHAQMPGFAQDLGHGDPGLTYTLLLGADAAGALLAGILLETNRSWLRTEPSSAIKLAFLWGCALLAFSLMRTYEAAIVVLFLAGFLELSFSSMTQALVQLNAPDTIRGRVLGLFTMSSLGLRTFSGLTVGLLGSVTNIHLSLALSAGAFMTVAGLLLLRRRQQAL
jgi:MFS family permease